MSDPTTLYIIGNGPARGEGMRWFEQWARKQRPGGVQAAALDLPPQPGREDYRKVVSRVQDEPGAVGALLASHRRELLAASRDQFADLTTEASLSGELSCLYKEDGQLVGHTTRPQAAGLALARFLGPGYWLRHDAELLCLGADGAAPALLTYVATRAPAGDRPPRLVLADHDMARLHDVEQLLQRLPVAGVEVQLFHTSNAAGNNQLLAGLPEHSVVVNASGQAQESPLTANARFPRHGAAWDLHHEPRTPFLHLAQSQPHDLALRVEDGTAFHELAWATGVGYVLGVDVVGGR